MYDRDQRFWRASIDELKQGHIEEQGAHTCLICGRVFEQGVIYPAGDRFLDAGRMVREHIATEHGGVFNYLLSLDKKLTGLTDLQSRIMMLLHRGMSDQEILSETGGGSSSTIRAHRFKLRERERQARVFLALMELLGETDDNGDKFIPVHKGATMVDERYAITEEEYGKVIATYFRDGRLTNMPARQKRKLMILRHIAETFAADTQYSEPEVNDKLAGFFSDYVSLRRYLIEYGFLERTRDGSRYWVKL